MTGHVAQKFRTARFALCCRPIPGDSIVGYLGHGEGLVVHTDECGVGQRLRHRDSERFFAVEWAEEPVRTFETGVVITVRNDKGVLARVATTLAEAEADITHVEMADETPQDSTDLRFVIAVRDRAHLDAVLRAVKRTPSVLAANRVVPAPYSVDPTTPGGG